MWIICRRVYIWHQGLPEAMLVGYIYHPGSGGSTEDKVSRTVNRQRGHWTGISASMHASKHISYVKRSCPPLCTELDQGIALPFHSNELCNPVRRRNQKIQLKEACQDEVRTQEWCFQISRWKTNYESEVRGLVLLTWPSSEKLREAAARQAPGF